MTLLWAFKTRFWLCAGPPIKQLNILILLADYHAQIYEKEGFVWTKLK